MTEFLQAIDWWVWIIGAVLWFAGRLPYALREIFTALADFLGSIRDAGLSTSPGGRKWTSAEIRTAAGKFVLLLLAVTAKWTVPKWARTILGLLARLLGVK